MCPLLLDAVSLKWNKQVLELDISPSDTLDAIKQKIAELTNVRLRAVTFVPFYMWHEDPLIISLIIDESRLLHHDYTHVTLILSFSSTDSPGSPENYVQRKIHQG